MLALGGTALSSPDAGLPFSPNPSKLKI